MFYLLKGHDVVPAEMEIAMRQFHDGTDRMVDRDEVGEAVVSTVFLVIDHRHFGDGPPLLFETMIFGGARDSYQVRYSTWDDAAAGHKEIVEALSFKTET